MFANLPYRLISNYQGWIDHQQFSWVSFYQDSVSTASWNERNSSQKQFLPGRNQVVENEKLFEPAQVSLFVN